MRWLTYFILAYLALGMQVGLGDYVSYQGATPNFVLLAAIFIAINAPRDAALLGASRMGAMHDLLTQQPPGLFALAYGLVGLMVAGTQPGRLPRAPADALFDGAGGGIVVAVILLVHSWIHPPGPRLTTCVGGGAGPRQHAGDPRRRTRPSPATELLRAVYTAMLAPFVIGVSDAAREESIRVPAAEAKARQRH